MYTFVKFRDKTQGEFPWMMECSSLIHLFEHSEKFNGLIVEGFKSLVHGDKSSQHAVMINSIAKSNDCNTIVASQIFDNRVFQSKLKSMTQFSKIYLREIGSYTIPSSDLIEIVRIEKPTMVYPDKSLSDIKITRFEEGKHWYVKIGNMDVIDDDGTHKFNTHSFAMSVALKVLKRELENGNS